MRFFFDRCLPLRLARILQAYDTDNEITHQDDDVRFVCTDEDISILEALSQQEPKPVFITADVNMRHRNPDERQALRGSGLTCVFMKKGVNNLSFHEQAWKILKLWPEIVRHTGSCREPTAFEVGPAARKVQRYRSTKEL